MNDLADLSRLAERRFGLVTLDDLLDAGVGERLLARWIDGGRLHSEGRGVFRMGGAPPSFEASVLAAVLVHGDETWVSHRTAAFLWEIPGFPRERRIELTRRVGLSNQRAGARVHRSTSIPDHHVALLGPIPVTTMSRTLFDLARRTNAKVLDRAVESALRTRRCSIASLYRVLHDLGGPGRPGTARMREILERRGVDYIPTESELDVLGRAAVQSLRGIAWQVPMSDERGYIRRVDGLHQEAGLVIEWDGAEFHDPLPQRELDADGDRRLEALGYAVRRYRWVDVTKHARELRLELEVLIEGLARVPDPGVVVPLKAREGVG